MKYNLLGAVSTIAIGAVFGIIAPGAANATYTLAGTGLTCTGLITDTSGTCSEVISISAGANLDFSSANSNNILTLDKWHAPQAGDQLASVQYEGGGTVTASGTLTNTGGASASGQEHTKMALTLTGGTPSNFLVPATSFQFNITAFSAHTTIAPLGSKSYTGTQSGNSALTSASGSLAGFIGSGTFAALASSVSSGGTSATPSTFSATGNIGETAFAIIDYNFTTPAVGTPEPATLALLGVGLAGLGAVRRRRKA